MIELLRMKRIVLTMLAAMVAAQTGAAETNALPTLTLAEAEALALRDHPRIAAANDRALAAQEVTTQKRSGYFPQASLFATAAGANADDTRILAGGLNNPSIYDRAAGGLQVSQLITDFGRTANLAAGARFAAQAENQNATGTRELVKLQVATSYLAALEAVAVLQVARQTFDTRQLLLDQVSALATNKLRSELDVSFARVAVEEGKLLMQRSQNDADAAMASLSTALGSDRFTQYQLTEPALPAGAVTNDVADLVQTALARRPELLSLRNQREASRRLARSDRDARLPTISAVGVAGGSPAHDSRLPDNYAAAALELSLPIFSGGYYTAQQREAELRAAAAAEVLRTAENEVIRDVRIAWLNLNNAMEQLQTAEELVRQAGEAYELAEARYKSGISSIVELSQAQLALTSAQITGINARYNVFIQQATLAYQTGRTEP